MPLLLSDDALNDFFDTCDTLSSQIRANKDDLIALLSKYETYETANDEIYRALDALQGVRQEISSVPHPVSGLKMATIFPLNLPLYSLVIFGIIPSVFSDTVFIRPPTVMKDTLSELWKVLRINTHFPRLKLTPVPRGIFIQLYAAECDVIIFTGKYNNAMYIHKQCPDALLIYNGSGVNPFIIFENANLTLATKKAVEMRCFNSGQDCAGPDAFFVPSTLADEFISKIQSELATIKVGSTTDPSVRVGPTMKREYIKELKEWLIREKIGLTYGGEIDESKSLVHPGIIRRNINGLTDFSFHEFFAPYFYIIEYDSIDSLNRVLKSTEFREKGMYISVFGDNEKVEDSLDFVQVIKNVNVNDIERGNKEYGGYGGHANFLLYGDKKVVHPILISRDIHAIFHA